MKLTILFSLFLLYQTAFTQKVINYEVPVEGSIQLTSDIAIPKVNKGYTLWLPKTGQATGLIVFTHARRDTTQSEFIIDYALANQLAVLYATTENRLEFFFDRKRILEIESYIYKAIRTYQIPKENLLFCGMSLEGTRALKLATFAQNRHSKYQLTPKAIAICDAPLDMVRFHKELTKSVALNLSPIAANEGAWVSACLESNLGGTPFECLAEYINYSPYSYWDEEGKNIQFLTDIALRAYTEPDVHWWMENRRKDYYGMNAVDMAALINELNILGNEKAELITTVDKGFKPDGNRHPHSWSIVDERSLVDWFVSLLNNTNLKDTKKLNNMKIKMTGVPVNDPIAAFKIYTETLGFKELMYMPEANLAIVVSSEDPDGTALLLEPNDNPISKTFQSAVYEKGLPIIVFGSEDVEKEYQRLSALGVKFKQIPTKTDWGIIAVFEDGCGNYIQIHQDL